MDRPAAGGSTAGRFPGILLAVLLAAATAATAAVYWRAVGPGNAPGRWPVLVLFTGWGLLPYLTLGVVGLLLRGSRSRAILLVAALLAGALAAWSFYQGFRVHLDPQSAVLLITVPLVQLGLVSAASVAALFARR